MLSIYLIEIYLFLLNDTPNCIKIKLQIVLRVDIDFVVRMFSIKYENLYNIDR